MLGLPDVLPREMMRTEQATEFRELSHPFGLAFGSEELSNTCVYSAGAGAAPSADPPFGMRGPPYRQWIPDGLPARNYGGCHAPSLAWSIVEMFQNENVSICQLALGWELERPIAFDAAGLE